MSCPHNNRSQSRRFARRLRALPALATALAVALSITLPSDAEACSCMMPTLDGQIGSSDAIFSGQIVGLSPEGGAPGLSWTNVRVEVAVDRIYKGQLDTLVTLYTNPSPAACGYDFRLDSSYLIFASQGDVALATSLCTLTQPLAAAGDEIEVLGDGWAPTPAPGEPSPNTPSEPTTDALPVLQRVRPAPLAAVQWGEGAALMMARLQAAWYDAHEHATSERVEDGC